MTIISRACFVFLLFIFGVQANSQELEREIGDSFSDRELAACPDLEIYLTVDQDCNTENSWEQQGYYFGTDFDTGSWETFDTVESENEVTFNTTGTHEVYVCFSKTEYLIFKEFSIGEDGATELPTSAPTEGGSEEPETFAPETFAPETSEPETSAPTQPRTPPPTKARTSPPTKPTALSTPSPSKRGTARPTRARAAVRRLLEEDAVEVPGVVDAFDYTDFSESKDWTKKPKKVFGGEGIGYIHDDNWLKYTVDVTEPGSYLVYYTISRDGEYCK